MNFDKINNFNVVSFTPKDSFKTLSKLNKKHLSSFENLKESILTLKHIDQKNFMLQVGTGNSIETYFFSVYKDESGYYSNDSKHIKHFRNGTNCLKYNIAKAILQQSTELVDYRCYEFNNITKNMSEQDFIYYAYNYGKRIFVN